MGHRRATGLHGVHGVSTESSRLNRPQKKLAQYELTTYISLPLQDVHLHFRGARGEPDRARPGRHVEQVRERAAGDDLGAGRGGGPAGGGAAVRTALPGPVRGVQRRQRAADPGDGAGRAEPEHGAVHRRPGPDGPRRRVQRPQPGHRRRHVRPGGARVRHERHHAGAADRGRRRARHRGCHR